MGELHSLAYTSGSSLHNSSQGWDFHHNLGILNTDTMSLVMDGSNASFLSSLDSDFSTGYLEDALVEFSEQSKRRRLMLYTEDDHQIRDSSTTTTFLDVKDYWNSSNWELSENFNCMMTQMTGFDTLSEPMITELKTPEEAKSVSEGLDSSSSSSYKDSANTTKSFSDKQTLFSTDPPGWELEHERKKKRVIKRVVYPFAVVKPGGKEGDVTLNDINERIMMPPTRPVRHPVGDFACRPCVSPDGPGLSGKAVVALTKIHTQGRGTITIIRTKG
ncbi:protein XRI1 isoform X2 [Ziziphus jujuba]|uniref:Protein XRI1 isoform X2 n=1 Tax=Ziziphus jujuba TaxID=326968 RepID=A0A6P4AH58_ZIZJJ|nr:protein XRI1 isoform X2 [Ziziphus jujuba]